MEICEINTFFEAKHFLKTTTNKKSIIQDIEHFIDQWKFRSAYDLTVISEDLDKLIEEIELNFFDGKNDSRIFKSIHCVVHNILWDNLKPLIRAQCNEDDTRIYEKTLHLCKTRKLPTETIYSSVPYTAAIVELSVWDSYNSPLEKLYCLCMTYDLIYAELKTALVNIISKYSEKEIEIPIINNEDVLPILSLVVMKSKLRYSCSNLHYIKLFGKKCSKDNNKSHILQSFEQIIQAYLRLDTDKLSNSNRTQSADMSFNELIEKFSEAKTSSERTLQEENTRRLIDLILESTTDNCDK